MAKLNDNEVLVFVNDTAKAVWISNRSASRAPALVKESDAMAKNGYGPQIKAATGLSKDEGQALKECLRGAYARIGYTFEGSEHKRYGLNFRD